MFSNKNIKTAAIICEYNPFHNGHLLHIQKTRELTGADCIIALMSGQFVQRGEPAVFDKYIRTQMALSGGADLVIELPTLYAVSSAERFAEGSIELLNALGNIDYLCFGSENGSLKVLETVAKILINEPESFKENLHRKLKDGVSFPAARSYALEFENADASVLNSPNNILGIEYLKALYKTNSSIVPFTIKREDCGYNYDSLSDCSDYASALAIRKELSETDNSLLPDSFKKYIPENILPLYSGKGVYLKDFDEVIFYSLLKNKETGYTGFLDVSEELSAKILKNLPQFRTTETFIDLLKSKNITRTSISRAIIHILLDITEEYGKLNPSYARILGFKKEVPVLHLLKNSSSIPLISKMADAKIDKLLQLDINASLLYSYLNHSYSNEFASSPIVYTS